MTKLDKMFEVEKIALLHSPHFDHHVLLHAAHSLLHDRAHSHAENSYLPALEAALSEADDIQKTAAPVWLRNAGKALGVGTGLFFGAQAGASLGKDVASLAHKGKVGLGSETRWKQDHKDRMEKLVDPVALAKARKAKTKAQWLGLAGGALATLAVTKGKKPLVALGGALTGAAAGGFISKRLNPVLSAFDMSPTSSRLSKTIGLLPKEKRKAWQELLDDPSLANDPELKSKMVEYYNDVAKQRPVYKSYARKQKTGSILGSILGTGAMAAGLIYGSKKGLLKSKNIPTSFQKALGGNPYWAWAGLGAAGLGLGVAKKLEGGRRARLTKEEIRKNAMGELMSQAGTSLLFYGGGPK